MESRTRSLVVDDLRQKLGAERPATPAPRPTVEQGERPRIIWRREIALAC